MIVFPMAGLSRRFAEQGYPLPKFMLPLWGGYVFDFAISSFRPRFEDEAFLFIFRRDGETRSFLDARTGELGIRDVQLVELPRETAGQAETVELGLDQVESPETEPLAIFNIDTFRRPDADPFSKTREFDGWLEVFRGTGDNWSFVRPSETEHGLALETAEKVVISDLCCTGLYEFASANLFREGLAEERNECSARELYIAPIYNHLIKSGHRIGYQEVLREDIAFCGVPDEYEELVTGPCPWGNSD